MSIQRFGAASSLSAVAVALTAGLAIPMPAFGQTVTDRTLADVKAETVGVCTTLTVNFNGPIQILSAFPAKGRELHVRIKPLDKFSTSKLRESLRTPTSLPELRSIEFEGDNPAGPTFSLFFTQDMEFSVSAGEKPQTLLVQISRPGAGACTLQSGASLPPASTGPAAIPAGLFVVNLQSSPATQNELSAEQQQMLDGQVVYESQFEKDSQQWRRLRAGFFDSKEAADAAKARYAKVFPNAWVVKVNSQERSQGISTRIDLTRAVAPTATAAATTGATPGTDVDTAETKRLIDEAELAIQETNLDRAIQLLTNATQVPENANTPRAIELLGLTRERKGQSAHAKAEYEDYLRRYPTGEGAERVSQRLSALGSGPAAGSGALREAGGLGAIGKWKWGVRGSFSQFYFRDQNRTNTFNTTSQLGVEVDNSLNLNQLLTNGDITISGGNDRRQFQIRAAGAYTKDFGTSKSVIVINNGAERRVFRNQEAVSALYFDYTDNDLNTQLRVGRQTRNSGGVLGRFDGAVLGWQAGKQLRINAVAGFPVLSSRQTYVLKERKFYGVSVDFGSKRSPIQTTLYWFDQHAKGGFIDRRSVGVEARFLKPRFNAYAMFDYDVKFSQLNLGLISMNYNFPDGANLSVTGDYRRSPLLTTTTALSQMSVATLDPVTGVPIYTTDTSGNAVQTFITPTNLIGLRPFFTDAQIYQLALDRTLIAKSVTVTYTRPITKKLQVSADFSLTDTGGAPGTPQRFYTDTSGNLTVPNLLLYNEISALPSTGKEYYYGLQFIGSDMLMSNDIYILSGRYADTSTAKIYTADVNARVPLTSNFRLSPRLRYGYREGKVSIATPNPGTFSQFQPTMRLNYYPLKHSELELEFGWNFSREKVYNGTSFDQKNETGWVLSAGYRLDF